MHTPRHSICSSEKSPLLITVIGICLRIRRDCTLLAAGIFVFMAAGTAAAALPSTQLLPVVPGDEATRSTPFIAWFQDLTVQGYVEEEYTVSGMANIYGYVDDAGQQPEVEVLTSDLRYVTRMLVRRPADPNDFNGTVFVEVLNATAGWDGDPIWQSTHEYMIREGAVWVGVSTKPVTVNFLRDSWGRPFWPPRNASRYAGLSMPDFGQVWDMLSQIGALLKTPTSADNPLGAFDVQRLIMLGYSQSAGYQVTYANSIHSGAQMADGTPIFDGYYIAAGGAGAKHVTGPTDSTPENLPVGDARTFIQVNAPVIRFQSQTEVVGFGAYQVRQPETDLFRFYEMAGGSHVDAQLNAVGGQALVRDLGLPPSFCPAPAIPYNPIVIGYVQAALMEALDRWIAFGATPPASRFMELAMENGSTVLARDADGNAVAGIRPPDIQVPLGTYVENNSGPGFCFLFGGFAPFDDAKLKMLYRNHGAYVSRFTQAVEDSEQEGFLLGEDAETQRDSAAQSSVGKKKK
jgi:hypothetical protein